MISASRVGSPAGSELARFGAVSRMAAWMASISSGSRSASLTIYLAATDAPRQVRDFARAIARLSPSLAISA
jgi:cytidylate kinase